MKADDSSLTPEQLITVRASARLLLDKGDSWGVFPTPVNQLVEAAGLELAPISAFDEGSMRRYLREAGEKAAQFLKGAIDKVMGIFDVHADIIHIDPKLYPDKQTFLKLHETGHKELPHQRGLFKWIQDCAVHLSPETAELFEREANTFASIVLFQDDAFANRTADEPFSLKVPLRVGKSFGASVYASCREYVHKHHKTCAVVVLEPTEFDPAQGPVAVVRRIEMSAGFAAQFGLSCLPQKIDSASDMFMLMPFEPRRMSSPQAFSLSDRTGADFEFVGEGLRTSYHTILLIHQIATLGKNTLLAAS